MAQRNSRATEDGSALEILSSCGHSTMPSINPMKGKGYSSAVYMKKKMATSFYNTCSPASPLTLKRSSVPPTAGAEFNKL